MTVKKTKEEKQRPFIKEERKDYSKICSNCNSTELILDPFRGEVSCSNCGYVLQQKMIDDGAEWRAYTSEESSKRSRVGSPYKHSLHDRGLSTIIGYENYDYRGVKLSSTKRMQIYRLRKWQLRNTLGSNASLAQALGEIERLASKLQLPRSVKETSVSIYRRAYKENIVRGRSIDGLVAASIYCATRIRRIPRTINEIAEESSFTKKELGKHYRTLVTKLNLKIPITNPVNFIVRFGTELKLSGRAQRKAAEIIKEARTLGISAGKDPTGLAASAIYIAAILCDERITQKRIAEVANVTEVTIRQRYKELVYKCVLTNTPEILEFYE